MAVRTEVINQIKMLGNPVVAEVEAGRAAHRRWLCLSPIEGRMQLLAVEVPVEVDPIDWPKQQSDYVIVSDERFDSLDAALAELRVRGVDTDTFDAVWKSENPF